MVTYDPEDRAYHIGKVTDKCVPADEINGITHKRNVEWRRTAPRDLLSASSRFSLDSLTTIFGTSPEVASDLSHAAGTPSDEAPSPETVSDPDDGEAHFATHNNGIERINDRALMLSWDAVEQLIAALLHSMGYHANVTSKSPDGGRDVVSSPDPLGLESPRIIAEVKHRKGAMGAPQIRSFIVSSAQATAASTSQPAVLPRRRATRPTAPTSPCAHSISTGW